MKHGAGGQGRARALEVLGDLDTACPRADDVALDDDRSRRQCFHRFQRRRLIARVVDGDGVPLVGQRLADRPAKPAAAACDERNGFDRHVE